MKVATFWLCWVFGTVAWVGILGRCVHAHSRVFFGHYGGGLWLGATVGGIAWSIYRLWLAVVAP